MMGKRLSPKQHRALQLLIEGQSLVTIASLLRLQSNTFSSWLRNAAFKNEYERKMKDMEFMCAHQTMVSLRNALQATQKEVASSAGDAKRIQALLNAIKTLPNMRKNAPNNVETSPNATVSEAVSEDHL